MCVQCVHTIISSMHYSGLVHDMRCWGQPVEAYMVEGLYTILDKQDGKGHRVTDDSFSCLCLAPGSWHCHSKSQCCSVCGSRIFHAFGFGFECFTPLFLVFIQRLNLAAVGECKVSISARGMYQYVCMISVLPVDY